MLGKTTRSILTGWGFGGFTPKEKNLTNAISRVSTTKKVGFIPFTYCLKGGLRGYPPYQPAPPTRRLVNLFCYTRCTLAYALFNFLFVISETSRDAITCEREIHYAHINLFGDTSDFVLAFKIFCRGKID